MIISHAVECDNCGKIINATENFYYSVEGDGDYCYDCYNQEDID